MLLGKNLAFFNPIPYFCTVKRFVMKKNVLFFVLMLSCLVGFGQTVNIGDILCTDGSTVRPDEYASSGKTAQGIVFYVDNTGQQGWAVNLHTDAVDTDWVTEAHYSDGYDIPDLPNCEYSRQALYDMNGYLNTAIIRATHGPDWYPAAWAVDFDNGWYLPAAGQMRWLLAYVNEINASLAIVNGSPFVLPYPDWHWTSTEYGHMHAVIVSRLGSVSNYMKWNYYNTYTIGVRAIKDFECNSTPEHKIGDVITTPGGQTGIVFYVSPDDGSYWLTALNDLQERYSWGNDEDILELDNIADEMSQWYGMQGIYCGYDATMQMRNAQGDDLAYAAHHVDFENGWHIPSTGQLSKLYAALPHIEEALIENGGSLPSGDLYWTSTENSNDKAWAIDFGSNEHLYQEGRFVATPKETQCKVRPVWSMSCEAPEPEPTLPDNIIESDCNSPLDGNVWDVALIHSTPEVVASYAPVIAGDIDSNGVVDILISHFNGNNYRTNTLDVYSGIDLSLQYRFNIQDSIYNTTGNYALCRYPLPDGSQQGAIFVHSYDRKIRSYTIDGTLLNVSDRATSCEGMVSFADFNGDGFPEVYAGSDIFDAATLRWLCSGPENGNKGESYRGSAPGVVNSHRCYYAMSLASNVLGDAKQELICGNTIYDVNIISRTNPALNSITVNKTITPPNGYSQDGHVSLADFDLDGECEVLVTRNDTDDHTMGTVYFYAYKPSNGQIIFQKTVQCLCAGYPLIGNIDDDPHPEIVFLEKQESWQPMYIYCWRYTLQSGLTTLWQHQHDDLSGQTGITLFDFNQDDIMELVYRDSDNLRIINGSGKSHITGNDTIRPYNIYTRMMAAGTGCEYPIVADVNGDGSAEILVSGMLDQSANLPGIGGLHMFGNPGNWAPARPVWNQYMYHVTNVNEDLTIPTYCFDKATVFTAPDGTIRRPYNNFLQQAYYITPEGEPYHPSGYLEVNVNGTGCNAYTFHGVTYTESGNYEQLVEFPDGCDTLYHIEVDLGSTSVYDWWQTACNSFTWNDITYTEPGDYTQVFSISNCDSIVHLHLSFAGQPEAIPEIIGLTNVNVGTDLIVGQYFYHIDSVPLATHYEWTLEGANWIMDTTGTHCSLLITTPGIAILKVRAWNDCGETEQEIVIHAGFFNVDEHQSIRVALYPNPANDKVLVEAEDIQSIKVYDMWGQLLKATDGANTSKVEISLHDLAAGIYTVEVLTKQGKAIKKLSIVK